AHHAAAGGEVRLHALVVVPVAESAEVVRLETQDVERLRAGEMEIAQRRVEHPGGKSHDREGGVGEILADIAGGVARLHPDPALRSRRVVRIPHESSGVGELGRDRHPRRVLELAIEDEHLGHGDVIGRDPADELLRPGRNVLPAVREDHLDLRRRGVGLRRRPSTQRREKPGETGQAAPRERRSCKTWRGRSRESGCIHNDVLTGVLRRSTRIEPERGKAAARSTIVISRFVPARPRESVYQDSRSSTGSIPRNLSTETESAAASDSAASASEPCGKRASARILGFIVTSVMPIEPRDTPRTLRRNLVVVANRLPVRQIQKGQLLTWEWSPGGLVSALAPVLTRSEGVWVGWNGRPGRAATCFHFDGIENLSVPLRAHEIEDFYNGFSNRTIWPLYHDAVRWPEYNRAWWQPYVEIN